MSQFVYAVELLEFYAPVTKSEVDDEGIPQSLEPELYGQLVGLIMALVFWLLWSLVTYLLGTTVFKGPDTSATYGELLRTIGFSTSPGVLLLFAFIPYIGGFISFVVWVWMLIAMVIAVRQALDFTTWRAIGTVLVGGIIYLVVAIIIGAVVGLGIYGVSETT